MLGGYKWYGRQAVGFTRNERLFRSCVCLRVETTGTACCRRRCVRRRWLCSSRSQFFSGHRVTGSISLNGSISLELAFAGRVVIGHTVSWARGQDTKSEHMTSLPLAWPCHLRIHAACLRPMRATPLLQTSCHWAHQKRRRAPLQQLLVRLTAPHVR